MDFSLFTKAKKKPNFLYKKEHQLFFHLSYNLA